MSAVDAVVKRVGPGVIGGELNVTIHPVVHLYRQRLIVTVDAAEDIGHGTKAIVRALTDGVVLIGAKSLVV